MKKLSSLFVLGALALAPVAANAQAAAEKGKMLYASGGVRLGAIYKVTADGSAQIILDGRLVTVPGSTISASGDKIQTSLTKNELISTH
ncbi:MAG TPA: hypothetical protein VF503_00570 [Sphingobium sp.]|uniref:hypothetical protein n=1 Tax=Sphingobium sp. TaxID=1912891 RepID=UPI002ED47BD0